MKVITLIISSYADNASETQRLIEDYLMQRCCVKLIFFFDQGVHHSGHNQAYWQQLARKHHTQLCCCTDSVERYLGEKHAVAPPFIITGMGTLAEACEYADETVLL